MEKFVLFLLLLSVGAVIFFSILTILFRVTDKVLDKLFDIDYDRQDKFP